MPAVAVAQPDIEAWFIAHIRDLDGSVTVFTVAGHQLYHGWAWEHLVQVDVRAGRNKKACRDLAEQARLAIAVLPDVPWPDGVISYLRCDEGPFWLPDDDGTARYCMRWTVRIHPARDLAAGQFHRLPAPGGAANQGGNEP